MAARKNWDIRQYWAVGCTVWGALVHNNTRRLSQRDDEHALDIDSRWIAVQLNYDKDWKMAQDKSCQYLDKPKIRNYKKVLY